MKGSQEIKGYRVRCLKDLVSQYHREQGRKRTKKERPDKYKGKRVILTRIQKSCPPAVNIFPRVATTVDCVYTQRCEERRRDQECEAGPVL